MSPHAARRPATVPTVQEPVRRDARGNWVVTTRTCSHPVTDDTPFADRWLMESYGAAKERFPMLANGLAEYYDFRLIPSIRRAQAAEERELAILADDRVAAKERNEKVDARIAAEEMAHGERLARLREGLAGAEPKLDAARLAAAIAVAKAGGLYDPASKGLGLELPERPSAESVAGREAIPLPSHDAQMAMPFWMEITISTVLGPFVGVSAFNAFGTLHLAHLDRDPLPLVLAAAGLGTVAVLTAGRAVKGAAALAAQGAALGQKSVTATLTSVGVAASVLAVHAVTDGIGLSRTSALRAQNGLGGAIPTGMVLVVASTFCLGYVAYAFVSGWRSGRAAANGPRIAHIGDEELAQRRKDWPTDERRAALAAVGACRAFEEQVGGIKERIEAAEAERTRRVDALEDTKSDVPETVSDAAKDRIDRPSEDSRGAQREADFAERRLVRAMGERPYGWVCWWWPWRTWRKGSSR